MGFVQQSRSKDYVVIYDCGDGQIRTAGVPPEAGYRRPVTLECTAQPGPPDPQGPAAAGEWSINANNYRGRLVLNWTARGWTGHVHYDAHRRDESLETIAFDPSSGRIEFTRPIPGATQIYRGVISGSQIEGQFNQGGGNYNYSWTATRLAAQSDAIGSIAASPDPLSAAAERGEIEAMILMAQRHDDEASNLHDPALALQWYRRAAEAGDPEGMLQTGLALGRGQGVARDDAEAVSWYQQAAEHGNAEAMTMLGWMIADGRGTTRDDAAAMAWFRRAAEAGETLALNHIGVMYREGRAGPPHAADALSWFTRAAQAGDPQGMMNLGQALARGSGTAPDPETAAYWLAQALRAGNSAVVNRVIDDAGQLPQATMQALQRMMQQAGFEPGAADGRFGPQTRRALERYAAGG